MNKLLQTLQALQTQQNQQGEKIDKLIQNEIENQTPLMFAMNWKNNPNQN